MKTVVPKIDKTMVAVDETNTDKIYALKSNGDIYKLIRVDKNLYTFHNLSHTHHALYESCSLVTIMRRAVVTDRYDVKEFDTVNEFITWCKESLL